MANKDVFCNVPWTNTHVYWDGSFGVCCSEQSRFVSSSYNLKTHTMSEWHNSPEMVTVRRSFLTDQKKSPCSSCYNEERLGQQSRRIKENYKSVIFTQQSFERSYRQSPWYNRFENPEQHVEPIDWHIDFGNECNLACKMCNANASSKIAAHTGADKVKVSWTTNQDAWQNFLKSIDSTPVKRIHVMGGEPMLMKRYHEFVDYLVSKSRFEISLSFVTNGTIVNQELINKLKLFANVDIEISIESLYANNDYIRQGCKIEKILENIKLIMSSQDDKLQLVLRTAPQLLSVVNYHKLIEYAFDNNIVIESILLTRPECLAIKVLPLSLREQLVKPYQDLQKRIEDSIDFKQVINGRSVGNVKEKLLLETETIIASLNEPEPDNLQELHTKLREHLMFWDKIYKFDAKTYLPEYTDFLNEIGYAV